MPGCMLTGIELVLAVRAAGVPLSELVARIPRLPQVVINSRVRRLEDWQEDAEFVAAVERATVRMGDRGRILVRPSGTEPKIRIMDGLTVDVGEVPGVTYGDEFVLIGEQEGARITADDVAEERRTINYEVTTALRERLPRLHLGAD